MANKSYSDIVSEITQKIDTTGQQGTSGQDVKDCLNDVLDYAQEGGGVSVSQNTHTGGYDINIGGTASGNVAKQVEAQNKGVTIPDDAITQDKTAITKIKMLKFVPPTSLKGHTFTLWRMCGSSENKIGIYDVTSDISIQFVTGYKAEIFSGVYQCEVASGYTDSFIYVEADTTDYSGLYYDTKTIAKISVIECSADDAVFALNNSLASKASSADLTAEVANRENAVSAESTSRANADSALLDRINIAVKDVHTIGEQLYNKANGSNGIAFGSNFELFNGTKYLSVQIEVNANIGDNFSFKCFGNNLPTINDILIGWGDTITSGETISGRRTASISDIASKQGEITLPDAAKYLLIAYNTADVPTSSQRSDFEDNLVVLKSDSYPTEYISYSDDVTHIVRNYWTDKNIWWCGTSIPKGKDDKLGSEETTAGNYPTQVGLLLGADVHNVAEGSSMCRANVRTGDYNGANIDNITGALTMTNDEAEAFITNYDTLRQLSGNTSWPSTLSDTYKQYIRKASFEKRLMPYLDGTYPMPDLFVIDHGHNDWKYELPNHQTDVTLEPTLANIASEVLAEDTYMTANGNANLESFFGSLDDIPTAKKDEFIASVNRNCFIGSVNFLITLILRYNPHARIMFVSNYEKSNGEWRQMSAVIDAQESLATSWAFPICEVYKYLGFSNHIIPHSKDWFNTTYPNRNATTDVNVFRAYNPDLVHPHSDTTGTSINIYAGVLAEFIKTIR